MDTEKYYIDMHWKANTKLQEAKKELAEHKAPRFADTYRATLQAKVDIAQREYDKWGSRVAAIQARRGK